MTVNISCMTLYKGGNLISCREVPEVRLLHSLVDCITNTHCPLTPSVRDACLLGSDGKIF